MINRLKGEDPTLANRTKFNEALEDILAGKKGHHIMDITRNMADRNYCDQFNKLNGFGQACYWRQVDINLELFDKGKISLKPQYQPDEHNVKDNDRSTATWSTDYNEDISGHSYYREQEQQDLRRELDMKHRMNYY